MVTVEEICEYLKKDGLPVSYDKRNATCRVNKGGGVVITTDGESIIVRSRNRDTVLYFPGPQEAVHEFDLFHGENVVRVKGKLGELLFRVPVVGKQGLRVVLEFDVDRDDKPDAGAVRVWK